MDPFSLSLGVLQVAGVAIKLSSLIHCKFKILRNSSREIKRIFKDFERQRKNFNHEIRVVFHQADQNEADIPQLLEDCEQNESKGTDVRIALSKTFGKDLDNIREIIDEIGSSLQGLQQELGCFDKILAEQKKDESVKDTLHRLRDKITIVTKRDRFEEQIQNMRQLIKDLRQYRKQEAEIKELQARPAVQTRSATTQQLSPEFGCIGKVRRASKAFHSALATAWFTAISAASSVQPKHTVKLMLDAKADDEVAMDVMILCHGHCFSPLNTMQPDLMRLHVKSHVVFGPVPSGLSTPPTLADAQCDGPKRRRVTFAIESEPKEAAASNEPDQLAAVNLQNAQNICATLHSQVQCGQSSTYCLGYLESCADETYRHSFFPAAAANEIEKANIHDALSVTINEILSHPVKTSVTIVDQFKLARKFAMAVLKFHATPWLNETFSLRDISFIRLEEADISRCLQSAHLDFDFTSAYSHSTCSNPDNPYMCEMLEDDMENYCERMEDAKLSFGIRNLTLWCLGVTMLQIEAWSAVEQLDDVVRIRRMAQKPAMIGNRYRTLARQCLECDFGFGSDLSKPRLQQAVYERVVGGLTEMIDSLSLD